MIFEYEGGVSQVYTPEAISKLIIVNANVNNVLIWRNYGENLALYTINEESLEEITNLLFKHMSMIGVKNKAHYVEPYDIPIDSYTFLLPTPNEHDDYYVVFDSMHLSEKNPVTNAVTDIVKKIETILRRHEINVEMIREDKEWLED